MQRHIVQHNVLERWVAGDREKFVSLDGVRGVGALCVVFAHIIFAEDVPLLFAHADAGVDLFFLLSGFVIAHAYEGALRTTMTVKEYVRARVLRLYPIIVLGAIFSFAVAVALAGGPDNSLWPLFLLQMLAIPLLVGAHTFPLNAAYWSLFFELFANLIHAAVVKHLTNTRLLMAAGAGAIGLVLSAFHFGSLSVGWAPATFLGGFARVTHAFALGLLFYRWRAAGLLTAPQTHVLVPLTLLVAAMAAPVPGGRYALIIHDLLTSLVLFPGILVLAIFARTPAWLAPILTWLGFISYPLYALHMPVIHLFSAPLTPPGVSHEIKALGWSAALAIAVLLAWAAAALYEPKARAWLGRVWRGKRRETYGIPAKA